MKNKEDYQSYYKWYCNLPEYVREYHMRRIMSELGTFQLMYLIYYISLD